MRVLGLFFGIVFTFPLLLVYFWGVALCLWVALLFFRIFRHR